MNTYNRVLVIDDEPGNVAPLLDYFARSRLPFVHKDDLEGAVHDIRVQHERSQPCMALSFLITTLVK